jgi:hypothetical protein
VASNLIPTVLQNLVSKTNDTTDSSFSLENIAGQLTGGQGLQGLLGSFGQGGGAGVMDKLKGAFLIADYHSCGIKTKLKEERILE